MPPRTSRHRIYLGLLLAAFLAARAAGYDHPLESYYIRDAYYLGTDTQRAARFLSHYVQTFNPPQAAGPYVAQIGVRTPYVQVVENSRQHTVGYSAQQAEQDYRKTPETVQVRVQILFPLAWASPVQPPPACQGVTRMNSALDCFPNFQFRFSQSKRLHPAEVYGVPIYSLGDPSLFMGGDVWFVFPAEEVASAPLRVTVIDRSGQKVSDTFDLMTLF